MRTQNILSKLDWISMLVYVLLVGIGWLNIYASGYTGAESQFVNAAQPYFKQLMWIGFSVILISVILLLDSKFYEAFAYVFFGATVLLLIAVLVIGTEIKGAKSWIIIGGFSIQPAEFAKFGTSLAIAKLLTTYNFNVKRFSNLIIAFGLIFIPIALVILQNDTGSALVYTVFVLVLYREGISPFFLISAFLAALYFILILVLSQTWVFGIIMTITIAWMLIKKETLAGLISLGIAILMLAAMLYTRNNESFSIPINSALSISIVITIAFLIVLSLIKRVRVYIVYILFLISSTLFTFSTSHIFENVLRIHQKTRIMVLLGLKDDPLGAGYNVTQSQIAIGSGGFLGKGFLKGTQTQMNFVPEQNTDFIFSIVGEEWGFIGTIFVLGLFLFLILRLIMLAERQRSSFSRIYGYCVAMILFFHVTINVGMAIGVAPVIGIPLPFFSYGGSSLWSFTILLFIFLRLDANRYELLH